MKEVLKYRLTGAIVIVALMVIFLPIVFDGAGYKQLSKLQHPQTSKPAIVFDQHFPELKQKVITQQGIPLAVDEKPQISRLKKGEIESPSETTRPQLPPSAKGWIVQTGVFSSKQNAESQKQALIKKGFSKVFYKQETLQGKIVYSVRSGPFEQSQAQNVSDKLLVTMQIKSHIKKP